MTEQPRLRIVPCSIQDARAYVAEHHRHHLPPLSGLFALAVADQEATVRGVAIVGRPVARLNQDGLTAEVTRVATDGCPNACSALYGACWRAARALGYQAAPHLHAGHRAGHVAAGGGLAADWFGSAAFLGYRVPSTVRPTHTADQAPLGGSNMTERPERTALRRIVAAWRAWIACEGESSEPSSACLEEQSRLDAAIADGAELIEEET